MFEGPSAIQQGSIVPIIGERDAQSGTGKTATFAIGILRKVNLDRLETLVCLLTDGQPRVGLRDANQGRREQPRVDVSEAPAALVEHKQIHEEGRVGEEERLNLQIVLPADLRPSA